MLPNDPQALAESNAGAGMNSGGGMNAATANHTVTHFPKIAGRLPSPNAHFDPASTGGSPPQPIPGEWLSGIRDADQLNGVNWSAPILFHADGTAAAAQVIILDRKSRTVTVSVRALTGGVSVSPIVSGGTR
ncbi:MAG: hypothetical protein ACM3U2_08455 [Deltaproteobacteria bacterium]